MTGFGLSKPILRIVGSLVFYVNSCFACLRIVKLDVNSVDYRRNV